MEFVLTVISECFDYFCIIVAFILARNSRPEYRAIAYLLLAEFFFHRLVYILGIQITDLLNPKAIYLAYIIIEMLIIVAMIAIQAHIVIIALIFINLGYNMLTIAHFDAVKQGIEYYDFYGLFRYFVGGLMLLELIYLIGIHKYVENYRRKHGFISINHIDRMFYIYRWTNNRLHIQGIKG